MEGDPLDGNAVNLAVWASACCGRLLQLDTLADNLSGLSVAVIIGQSL